MSSVVSLGSFSVDTTELRLFQNVTSDRYPTLFDESSEDSSLTEVSMSFEFDFISYF